LLKYLLHAVTETNLTIELNNISIFIETTRVGKHLVSTGVKLVVM